MEETGVPGENHRPVASHWQTLWHNSNNISGDKHSLHRQLYILLPYDHGHDRPCWCHDIPHNCIKW